MIEPLLTPPEAAKLLRVSQRKLAALTRSGAIPSRRVGARSVRYEREQLQRWIAAQPSAARDAQPAAAAV